MQLLPDHNLRKHPYTYNYSQITTSKNTHIHTTTPRSQPQKTPIYTLLLSEHDLKNTHIHATTPRSRPQKTPIYTLLPPDHDLKKHPYTYNYSQITTSKDIPLKSINIKKWG